MMETEKMQQLHHRATIGEDLSSDEQEALENWYAEMDRQEEVINRNNRPLDLEALRTRLAETTTEFERKSREIAVLLRQNEQIKKENQQLKEILASQLSEQAA